MVFAAGGRNSVLGMQVLSFHVAIHFSFGIFLLEGFTFVVLFFASGKGYAQFGESFLVEEEADGHDGESAFLRLAFEFDKFFVLQQELAVAAFNMVVVGAQFVLGNVHPFYPQFPVVEIAVGVDEAGFPGTDGFDFRPR